MITKHPSPRMGTNDDILVQRAIAYLIDGIILGIGLGGIFAVGSVLGGLLADVHGLLGLIVLGLAFLIGGGFFVYYIYLMEGHLGRTVGKAVMGLVVVGEDGSQCTYGQSVIRNLLWIVDGLGFFPVIVALIVFITEDNQRVGDMVAKTVVVEARE